MSKLMGEDIQVWLSGSCLACAQTCSVNISSDDIVFETETELSETLTQRRQMIFQLLEAGLLSDSNGKVSAKMKAKILESLGFGVWDGVFEDTNLENK